MKKKCIISIDIGSESIKIFSGFTYEDDTYTITDNIIAPVEGFSKGELTDIDALCHSIRQALDCTSLTTELINNGVVFLGIDGSFLTRNTTTGEVALSSPDKITEADIKKAYKAAKLSCIPEDQEVLYISHAENLSQKVISSPQDGLKVLTHIISIDKKILETLKIGFLKNKIKIDNIVIKSIAGATAAILNLEDQKQDFLFIDVGAGSTEIALISDGCIKTTNSIPLGGIYITNDIKTSIDVDFFHAEAINRYYSKLDKNLYGQNIILDCNNDNTKDKLINYDLLHNIIQSRTEEIIALIHDYVITNIYNNDENLYKKINIVLAGGCANSNSLNELLAEAFECDIKKIDLKDLSKEYNSPQNACCYGIFQLAKNKFPFEDAGNNKKSPQNFSRFLENISKKIFKQEDQHA
ncbi:rod shape-determining protein [Selenomonadales bacterium OttesenSCG-928-I06]|nr:rod shape-determining protein [Selenomonadales bacterium OttesenSCG-928-I06]